jgi:hypothetical protein
VSNTSARNTLMMAAALGAAVLASAMPGTARAQGCLKGAFAGVVTAHLLHTGHSLTAAALGCIAGHEAAVMSAQGAGTQPLYPSYGGTPAYGTPGYAPNLYPRPYAGASAMVTQTPNELR